MSEEEKLINYLNNIDITRIFYDNPPHDNHVGIGGAIQGLLDLYNKGKNKNRKLDRENQALYESINCDDNTMLVRLYQEEKEKNECLIDNLNHSIRTSAIKEALMLEEDITEEEILNYIDILVSENNRLEDIEDKKVQIEYQNVFNKGVKSVEKKIQEKIEELFNEMDELDKDEYDEDIVNEKRTLQDVILCLKELLEE